MDYECATMKTSDSEGDPFPLNGMSVMSQGCCGSGNAINRLSHKFLCNSRIIVQITTML